MLPFAVEGILGMPADPLPSVSDHVRYPLALVMNPRLLKELRNIPISPPGGRVTIPGSGIIEAADLPKEDFLKMMKSALNASTSLRKQKESDLVERRRALVEQTPISSKTTMQDVVKDKMDQLINRGKKPVKNPLIKSSPPIVPSAPILSDVVCRACEKSLVGKCPIHVRKPPAPRK